MPFRDQIALHFGYITNERDLIMNAKEEARDFLRLYFQETQSSGFESRWAEVENAFHTQGTYVQTLDEITFGARLAWRNSNRCIGRLFWPSLHVIDARHVQTEEEAFAVLQDHLQYATNDGKIRSTLTVFDPQSAEPIKLLNRQLIRYAGYDTHGDPLEKDFTHFCQHLGWEGAGTPFDVLPWVIQRGNRPPVWFHVPANLVLEVPIAHPNYPFLTKLALKWYAVPAISHMPLRLGGITYTCAPFNGWYMLSEIATRNFGDESRYNLLPKVAHLAGLDTSKNRTLWKDEALLILNKAVQWSFDQAAVRIVDPHTAGEQFDRFCKAEEAAGRTVQADWSWIVPPTAGSTIRAFHQTFSNDLVYPNFLSECPFSGQVKTSQINEDTAYI